ncbi:hypothetical protein RvY_16144 [Ramazzottius varieornatus]|uniref:Uncharacterized protein n=1 Tax=Ramazzottius varieornatus TaxID=947166 RepID=A0A1D1VXF7_RAMVA|nr:hypothetical protein RvY_16144 [Ramazzottius varieornatus]
MDYQPLPVEPVTSTASQQYKKRLGSRINFYLRKSWLDCKTFFQVNGRLIWKQHCRDLLFCLFWTIVFFAVLVNDIIQYAVVRDVSKTSQVLTVPILYSQIILVYYTMACYFKRLFCRAYQLTPQIITLLAILFWFDAALLAGRLILEIIYRDTRPEFYPSTDNSDIVLDRYAGLGNY